MDIFVIYTKYIYIYGRHYNLDKAKKENIINLKLNKL